MLLDLAEFLPQLPLLYVALGLWLVYMISAKSRLPDNIPPTPVRPYPIVGHIPYLRDPKEQLPKKMQKWRAKWVLFIAHIVTFAPPAFWMES